MSKPSIKYNDGLKVSRGKMTRYLHLAVEREEKEEIQKDDEKGDGRLY